MLGPLIARPLSRVLGAPLARRGPIGQLARSNAMRMPKRTASHRRRADGRGRAGRGDERAGGVHQGLGRLGRSTRRCGPTSW